MKRLILSMLIVGSLSAGVANAEAQTFVRIDLGRNIGQTDRYIYNQHPVSNDVVWNGRRDNGRHLGWNNANTGRYVSSHDARWVDYSQAQQREMLEQGLRSGRITPAEFRQLSTEQRAIRQEARVYLRDGHLSGAERAELQQDLQMSWRNIRSEMADGEQRRNFYYFGR